MAEYISKEEAIKIISGDKIDISDNHVLIAAAIGDTFSAVDCFNAINDTCDRHVKFIQELPFADVQPVKHGKWDVVEVEDVSTKSSLPITTIASMWCSQCNRFHNEIYYYGDPTEYANYCPHCGAKMDGEKNG